MVNKMEKYLITVDLDDTLLTSEKQITQESIEYIRHLVSLGHHFIINTGRPFQGALRFLKTLGIHEPMIVNNGSAIVYFDENYENIIDYHLFPMNINKVKKFNHKIKHMINSGTVTSLFKFYSYDFSKVPFWIIHEGCGIEFVEGDIEYNLNTTPHISEYLVKKEYEKEFEKILNQKQFESFHYIKWGSFDDVVSFEIASKKASKGLAMEYLRKKYNIKKENTISFGDQLNDLSMIEMANYGVAMINSRTEVKEKAKYTSEFDFNNNGVISFLKNLFND